MARSTIKARPDGEARIVPDGSTTEPETDGHGAELVAQVAPVGPWPRLLLRTMRPKQWSKNAVVFAALVFAFRLRDVQAIALTFAAFVLFCLLSSAVYIMNDL